MILIPKRRELIVPIRHNVRVAGFYKIEAVGADGRRRTLADWFPNLITTLGANTIGNAAPLTFCAVGSGNAAPALSDTTLQSLVASTSSTVSINTSSQSTPPYFGTNTTIYNFGPGVAAGNLSEVGVGDSPTSLFSRALILDGGGSPTTITVLGTESLYVTYQLRQYVPTVDVTGTVNISGTNYTYTLRAANANTNAWAYQNGDAGGMGQCEVFDGVIGSVTGSPAGAAAIASSIANDPYSVGSHALTGTATWDIASGNFGTGVKSALALWGQSNFSRGAYQIQFGTAIPKDASHVLTLSFSTNWVINSP